MLRVLINCGLLLFPLWLSATGGPGKPATFDERWVADLLSEVPELSAADFAAPMSSEDQAAMAAMFAAEPAVLEGDDLRFLGRLAGNAKDFAEKARAFIQQIKEDPLRQLSSLVDAQLTNLPLGVSKSVGNVQFTLAIGEARLKSTYAEIDLYLGLDLPNTAEDPLFMARGVKWSRKSGFIDEVEMRLVGAWGINVVPGKAKLILHPSAEDSDDPKTGTYAVVTCDGLQKAQILGTVILSRDWVVPVIDDQPLTGNQHNADRNPRSNVRVHGNFGGVFDAENGFFFESMIPRPFAFKDKEDVRISVGQVVVDYSSTRNTNSPVMRFPEGYNSPFVNPQTRLADKRWEGLYIRDVSVTLPEKFRKNDSPLEVGAPQIIIDDTGVSTHLYVDNIMPLGNKNVGKWAFSVDSLDFRIIHSNFEEASLTGLINVPMLAGKASCGYNQPSTGSILAEDCLTYQAIIRAGREYSFGVSVNRDYCIPVFKAGELIIEENTKISLNYIDEELSAEAALYGMISIDATTSNGDVGFQMDSLSFDSLLLRTQAPYFSPGRWDFPKAITAKFKKFELGFRQIRMAQDSLHPGDESKCQLFFQAYVNVNKGMDLDVTGAFRMLGELSDEGGGQRWKYRALKLDAMSIYASTSSFTVGAKLAFYGQDTPDPEWGTGFYGYGELLLAAIPDKGVGGFGAVAQFGEKMGNKYFMVDIMGVFSGTPIPVFPGLELGAIGGGVYYNMRSDEDFMSMNVDGTSSLDSLRRDIDEERDRPEPDLSALTNIVGSSLSGKQYYVDPGNKGIYVQLVLVGPNENAYSITGRLEVELNNNNGWQASITASAQLMNPPNYSGNLLIDKGVGLYVNVAVTKQDDKISFEAAAEVFVNVYDGVIVGINTPLPPGSPDRARFVSENGFAGGAYLKFSPDEWYFRIGTPTAPLGVKDPLSSSAVYFCVGNNIPPIPPLPDNVTSIVGELDLSRDQAAFQSASGFAFGAEKNIGREDRFLIFHYNLTAGIGFDVNLRNYGDAVCADDPDGASIGINGWYAAGQAWAYITGGLKVLGKNVASVGLAAVLQLVGPRPTMARGRLAGYYQIGGGRKKTFQLDAQFGNTCTIIGRDGEVPFASIDVMTSSSVRNGATDVPTSVIPQINTSMVIDEDIEIDPENYRVRVTTNQLVNTTTGEIIEGETGQAAFRGAYSFSVPLTAYLAPETQYEYRVGVEVLEMDGPWNGTSVKTEDSTIVFTTGAGSTEIDYTNVEDAYPYDGMGNLYVREYDQGVVMLKRAQPAVMNDLTAVWTRRGGGISTSSVNLDGNNIRFNVPSNLVRDRVYELSLVQNYTSGGGTADTNQNTDTNSTPPGGSNTSMDAFVSFPTYVTQLSAPLAVEERTVYRTYFRTSRYYTFAAKVEALTDNITDSNPPYQDNTGPEGWSSEEIYAIEGELEPLVTVAVNGSGTWPSANVRTNILKYDNPVYLNGTNVLGSPTNGSQQSFTFDDVRLVHPRAKDAIYFNVTDSLAGLPPPVSVDHFDQGGYDPATGGQRFIFSYTKTIATNLQRFKEGLTPIPDAMWYILANSGYNGNNASSLPGCVACLDNVANLLDAMSNPQAAGQMSTQSPQSLLKNYWSQEQTIGTCPLPRAVRMALRNPQWLDGHTEYRNRSIAVSFRYHPPGQSVHSVTCNVRVK